MSVAKLTITVPVMPSIITEDAISAHIGNVFKAVDVLLSLVTPSETFGIALYVASRLGEFNEFDDGDRSAIKRDEEHLKRLVDWAHGKTGERKT